MVTRKLELKLRYDETAQLYDQRYEEIQRAKHEFILSELPNSGKILDLGCGTWILLGTLARRSSLAVGVDISSHMLRVARQRCDAQLVLADADHLPFRGESFDAVVSVTLLQNMPDPARTMRETARVAKPRATVVLTVLKHKHSLKELEEWVRGAGFKLVSSGKIPSSEDVFCVAVR